MKSRFRWASALGLVAALALPTHAQLRAGDLVAICGDSITERTDYPANVATYFLACQPEPDLESSLFGWGGETTGGFLARLSNDVLRFEPDVVTTFYGMNDGGYAPLTAAREKRFTDNQRAIVGRLRQAGVRTILLASPGCVDTTTYHKGPQAARAYNRTLARLRDIAQEIAASEDILFVDVHSIMMDVMESAKERWGDAYPLAGEDGVHPGPNGHLVITYAMLKGLGCDGDIGTIRVSLADGRAEASEGHEVLAMEGNEVRLRSTRYPFCFRGEADSPRATTGVIGLLPFNEELNRLRLVVSGVAGEKVRVTWGEAAVEFAGDELEQGINLTAHFLDNPFGPAFERVRKAVRAQQTFENRLVNIYLHNIPFYQSLVPDERRPLERMAQKLVRRAQPERNASAAAVVPVEHTLRIERLP